MRGIVRGQFAVRAQLRDEDGRQTGQARPSGAIALVELVLTATFERSRQKLAAPEQRLVDHAVMELWRGSTATGLRLHQLNCAERRFHSISPNDDLRVIVLIDGPQRVLMYVDHHDKAYRWAARRRVEEHPVTGTAQIVETVDVVRERTIYASPESAPLLFAGEDDAYLLSLGVPPDWLGTVRQIRDHDELLDLCESLPEEAWEALATLADGQRPKPSPVAAQGAGPFATPDARRRFRIFTDETALAEALSRPWHEWAVYLHPSQWMAVVRDHSGPARVTGSAGTGKTVVAMHRAARLAGNDGATVLLTTYSKALAGRLAQGMDVLLEPGSAARARVMVRHLHAVATEILSSAGRTVRIPAESEIRKLLEAHRGGLDPVRWPDAFLLSEWNAIIDYWGVRSWDSYRMMPRTGRGQALGADERAEIWVVFEAVRATLDRQDKLTWSDACESAADLLLERRTLPYDHVILDEAQDFGPRELAFAVQLANDGPNSLFFTGDIGQRIYRFPFSWSSIGINIRGRSSRLAVNYRTSEQIRRFADRILPPRLDEIGGGMEARTARSLLRGPEPKMVACANRSAETSELSRWLEELGATGVAPHEIAILARTRRRLDAVADPALESLGLSRQELRDVRRDAVYSGTLHGAKGLEFRAVAIVGCEDNAIPNAAALAAETDEEARAQAEERERHLLYVGCTRARDGLMILSRGPISRFLGACVDPNPNRP